uniref:Lipase domain-containing protein n=1 Tax=Glossina brevipalpis TaxID=37001 RepID=A0A1A9WGJ0_9MUSC
MNSLGTVWLLIGTLTVACAVSVPRSLLLSSEKYLMDNALRAAEWISLPDLEPLPSLDKISFKKLEEMPLEEAAEMLNKLYHLSKINRRPVDTYIPNTSDINALMIATNNEKISFKLSKIVQTVMKDSDFGKQVLTIFLTGLPNELNAVKKANDELIQAYMQRYKNLPLNLNLNQTYKVVSSEEMLSDKTGELTANKKSKGNLIVVDLGSAMKNFKEWITLDIEEMGTNLGNILTDLTDKVDVPQEVIHIIGQGVAAHVAGVAGRQYSRVTGHRLRRITGLDPSKIFVDNKNVLTGLARGDADFVDVIHTSSYSMGTVMRCGDVDFYPDGPNQLLSGSKNVIEASMRATCYFADTVVPLMERNFPAVSATSLQEYKNKKGYGKRVYLGISTDFDLKGDYVLEVNTKNNYDRNTPIEKSMDYHSIHMPWKTIDEKLTRIY